MKRLYRKLKNLRMPPYAIAALITYLETRTDCGDLPGCKPLASDVAGKLGSELYNKIFTEAFILGKKDFVGGFENGASFHMAMLAFYQLSYEAGADVSQPLDIERNQSIPLYQSNGSVFGDKAFQRRTDIVLKNQGAGKENWVETKSYKSPFEKARYTIWNFSRGKQSRADLEDGESRAIHRQFFLDRVATQAPDEKRLLGGDMNWLFHGFDRNSRGTTNRVKGYTDDDLQDARDELIRLPDVEPSVVKASIGTPKQLGSLRRKIRVFDVKNEIFQTFRQQLFGQLSEEDMQKLVLNSEHDRS